MEANHYSNRIAFTGEILEISAEGISKSSSVISTVPRFSNKIHDQLMSMGA